jgi:hypothetical protein
MKFLWSAVSLLAVSLACLGLAGCGRQDDPRITPLETARKSLDSALTAWQNGRPPGKVDATSPPVQVVDSLWKRGEKLKSHEILGEESDAEGLRWFKVRLELDKAGGSQEARYLVMGSTNITVFREEDYMLSRSWKTMDNNKK